MRNVPTPDMVGSTVGSSVTRMSALASRRFQGVPVLFLRGVLMTALTIAAVAPAMPAQIAEQANASVAAGSALSPERASRKNGTAATLLAVLIPGSGHIYAGETGKGLALLAGTVAAAGIGYSYSKSSVRHRPTTAT